MRSWSRMKASAPSVLLFTLLVILTSSVTANKGPIRSAALGGVQHHTLYGSLLSPSSCSSLPTGSRSIGCDAPSPLHTGRLHVFVKAVLTELGERVVRGFLYWELIDSGGSAGPNRRLLRGSYDFGGGTQPGEPQPQIRNPDPSTSWASSTSGNTDIPALSRGEPGDTGSASAGSDSSRGAGDSPGSSSNLGPSSQQGSSSSGGPSSQDSARDTSGSSSSSRGGSSGGSSSGGSRSGDSAGGNSGRSRSGGSSGGTGSAGGRRRLLGTRDAFQPKGTTGHDTGEEEGMLAYFSMHPSVLSASLFVRNADSAFERDVQLTFGHCLQGGVDFAACMAAKNFSMQDSMVRAPVFEINLGSDGDGVDFELGVHGWKQIVPLRPVLEAALPMQLGGPLAVYHVLSPVHGPLEEPDAFFDAFSQHASYHAKLGFNGTLLYLRHWQVPFIAASPCAKLFVSAGTLRLVRWDEFSMPGFEDLKYQDQAFVYAHALLSFWGTRTRLFFADLDEFLALRKPGASVPDLLSQPRRCLAVSSGCARFKRFVVHPSPRAVDVDSDDGGALQMLRLREREAQRFGKVLADPNRVFAMFVHDGGACEGRAPAPLFSSAADNVGGAHGGTCSVYEECMWVDDVACAAVMHWADMITTRIGHVDMGRVVVDGWM